MQRKLGRLLLHWIYLAPRFLSNLTLIVFHAIFYTHAVWSRHRFLFFTLNILGDVWVHVLHHWGGITYEYDAVYVSNMNIYVSESTWIIIVTCYRSKMLTFCHVHDKRFKPDSVRRWVRIQQPLKRWFSVRFLVHSASVKAGTYGLWCVQ